MIANSLVFLCANLLGLVSAIMAERTLRNAFLETKASLSVSLVLEESLKEQVNALTYLLGISLMNIERIIASNIDVNYM